MTLQAVVILILVVTMIALGAQRKWTPFLNCLIGLGVWLLIVSVMTIPIAITAGSMAPVATIVGIGVGLIVAGAIFKRRLKHTMTGVKGEGRF